MRYNILCPMNDNINDYKKIAKKQKEMDLLFLDIANLISKKSYATRKKVGGVLVKDDNIISFGWNGTPSGFNNCCETADNETKPEVLHAELNIFSKLARSTLSSENSTLYVTLSPCMECSKLIIQSGVNRVVYSEIYRNTDGIEFLHKGGIQLDYIERKNK